MRGCWQGLPCRGPGRRCSGRPRRAIQLPCHASGSQLQLGHVHRQAKSAGGGSCNNLPANRLFAVCSATRCSLRAAGQPIVWSPIFLLKISAWTTSMGAQVAAAACVLIIQANGFAAASRPAAGRVVRPFLSQHPASPLVHSSKQLVVLQARAPPGNLLDFALPQPAATFEQPTPVAGILLQGSGSAGFAAGHEENLEGQWSTAQSLADLHAALCCVETQPTALAAQFRWVHQWVVGRC